MWNTSAISSPAELGTQRSRCASRLVFFFGRRESRPTTINETAMSTKLGSLAQSSLSETPIAPMMAMVAQKIWFLVLIFDLHGLVVLVQVIRLLDLDILIVHGLRVRLGL